MRTLMLAVALAALGLFATHGAQAQSLEWMEARVADARAESPRPADLIETLTTGMRRWLSRDADTAGEQ